MHIFKYKGQGGANHDESMFTRMSANVTNGLATITRRMYFEADSGSEDAIDIMVLDEFPAKYAAHPKHPAYKFYGNANIQPLSERSSYWMADLEYSATDPNATDMDGEAVTSETKPWRLRPDNISFTYPEVIIPFEEGYDAKGRLRDEKGRVLCPVRNAAGDPLLAETSVRNLQMSFTFATRQWDINNMLDFGNTINSHEITVCGLKIPACNALLLPPECSYIKVYHDNSSRVKWEYWSVNINIIIDRSARLLVRKMLNVGFRARFKELDLSQDELLKDAGFSNKKIQGSSISSQICRFRLARKVNNSYYPGGNIVFCSWDQYLEAKDIYKSACDTLNKKNKSLKLEYDLQCEQDNVKMPLDENGYLLTKAIPGTADYDPSEKYQELYFREYPVISWKSLDLPEKGIKW